MTPRTRERVAELKRECNKRGIRYVSNIYGMKRLEAILSDPYDQKLYTYRRYWGISSFDFRGKGITPQKGASIKWKPLYAVGRMKYRCVGKFDSLLDDEYCYVTYSACAGWGDYWTKRIRISVFQIIEYSECKQEV